MLKGLRNSVVVQFYPEFLEIGTRRDAIHGCVAGFALKMLLKLSRY